MDVVVVRARFQIRKERKIYLCAVNQTVTDVVTVRGF